MSWHIYRDGEAIEVRSGDRWQPATFIEDIMSPTHKGIVELTAGGERITAVRDDMRPTGPARGRLR